LNCLRTLLCASTASRAVNRNVPQKAYTAGNAATARAGWQLCVRGMVTQQPPSPTEILNTWSQDITCDENLAGVAGRNDISESIRAAKPQATAQPGSRAGVPNKTTLCTYHRVTTVK
jgi:hypothetical protein